MKLGIFYGSTTGVTKKVAEKVGELLSGEVFNVKEIENIEEKIKNYDMVILATSSFRRGDVQGHWERHLKPLGKIDFKNKNVALIGVGDQEFFGKTFVGGMGVIYSYIKYNNINLLGKTKTDGYEFEDSSAVDRRNFVGLVIDDKNQKELTDIRIEKWVNQLKDEMNS